MPHRGESQVVDGAADKGVLTYRPKGWGMGGHNRVPRMGIKVLVRAAVCRCGVKGELSMNKYATWTKKKKGIKAEYTEVFANSVLEAYTILVDKGLEVVEPIRLIKNEEKSC